MSLFFLRAYILVRYVNLILRVKRKPHWKKICAQKSLYLIRAIYVQNFEYNFLDKTLSVDNTTVFFGDDIYRNKR